MKKKNLALLCSTALLSLALAGTIGAFATHSAAADTDITQSTESHQGTTTVKYQVGNTWTVTISSDITITGGDSSAPAGEGTVTVKDLKIEKGKSLKVTVNSANNFEVKDSSGSQGFQYELRSNKHTSPEEALKNGDTVVEVEAGASAPEQATLSATLTGEDYKKYSTGGDEYIDTLTFTVNDGATD